MSDWRDIEEAEAMTWCDCIVQVDGAVTHAWWDGEDWNIGCEGFQAHSRPEAWMPWPEPRS